MKRNILFSSAILGALAIILTLAYVLGAGGSSPLSVISSEASQGGAPSSDIAVSLSGFRPHSTVRYNVISDDNQHSVISAKANVDERGQLHIPRTSDLKNRQESALTYTVRVDQSDKPLDLRLSVNSLENEITVSGNAQEQFSDVLIETAYRDNVIGQSKTKTDWAGFFRDSSAPLVGDNNKQADTYKVVLYGHVGNDAIGHQPLTVKVFSAPGGGGRTSQGVNEFQNLYCEDEPVELSVCDEDTLNDQNEIIVTNYVFAFASMAEQLSAVMMQQIGIIGSFFDASVQLGAERELQALQAEAVKDYHPSEQMCQFGSFMRTISKTEEKAKLDTLAVNALLTSVYTNQAHGSSAEGPALDLRARVDQFSRKYCDPADNNNGLAAMCDHSDGVGALENARKNKDIDYTRTFDYPLTLAVDFTDSEYKPEEEDIIALARNLYWPAPLLSVDKDAIGREFGHYMDARQIMAIHNVAHNSFAEIVGLKAQTPPHEESNNGPAFMKALLKDLGVDDIEALLGESPSYYAQMEVLTKKIYQNPDFYTNLYTKPANIERIHASLGAIQLMQSRDHFDAALRREMLTSLMVEEALAKRAQSVN